MFKLWFMIEYGKNKKGDKDKLSNLLKFLKGYILPSLIFTLVLMNFESILGAKVQLEIFIVANFKIMCLTHFMIQKLFFGKLEKDVIIKFLPNRMYEYISVRLIMILLKWNLPIILSSALYLKKVLICPNLIFYTSLIVFLVSWFIVNYIIALALRYLKSVMRGSIKIIANCVLYIFCFVLFFIAPQYVIARFFDYLAAYFKNTSVNDYINVDTVNVIILAGVFVLVLILMKFISRIFKRNIRKLILNIDKNKKFELGKRFDGYIKLLMIVFARGLSDVEKSILIKDIKNLFRENLVTFSFLIIGDIINVTFLIYIYFESIPNSFDNVLEVLPAINLFIFIFLFIRFFSGNVGFKEYFDISNDEELLNKYGIKIRKKDLIKSKRRFATIVFFLPTMIFYCIAFIFIINIWSWVLIIFSLISTIIMERILSLITVKRINSLNSENRIIILTNLLLIAISGRVFRGMAISQEFLGDLPVYIIFNILLIVCYLFNVKININKVKYNEERI